MRQHAVPLFAAATILVGVAGLSGSANAQSAPQPVPATSVSPSPAPTKKPARYTIKIETYTSGTNQQFVGPGTVPAEGANFSKGGEPAPGTPYDFFSGAPETTGQGITQDFLLTPVFFATPNTDISVTLGYGSASGTGNVVNYWGDAIMPSINTNLGSRAYQLSPTFTTHNGQDPISATRLGVLSGSVMDHNGNGGITLGWFNLHQNVGFAMTPAPWVSTPFEVIPQLPGNLGDGNPSIDVLKESAPYFPLSGVDAWYKTNPLTTFEVASALLPAPTNAPARIDTVSGIVDHGGGLRYSAQLSMLNQTGAQTIGALYGTGATLTNGVPQSTLFGQHQFVGGVGVQFPINTVDAEARYGYSCYNATGSAASTSACTSGNYLYGKLHHGFNSFDVSLEGVRNDPSYAPAALDYGTLQNTWQYPAAWPGNFLRGEYQVVDNTMVGPNRQGVRLGATTIVAGVEVRLSFAHYTQIQALDGTTSFAAGFNEPYFLPQLGGGSLGVEQRAEGFFSYHAKWADVVLDLAQVNTWRAGTAGAAGNDAVRMVYPMGTFALTRPFGPKVTGTAGVGRFGLNGQFDTAGPNNASLAQDVFFAGAQYRTNSTSGYGLEYRLYSVDGNPTIPGAASPAYHGPQIQFYQRFKT